MSTQIGLHYTWTCLTKAFLNEWKLKVWRFPIWTQSGQKNVSRLWWFTLWLNLFCFCTKPVHCLQNHKICTLIFSRGTRLYIGKMERSILDLNNEEKKSNQFIVTYRQVLIHKTSSNPVKSCGPVSPIWWQLLVFTVHWWLGLENMLLARLSVVLW